MTDERNEALKLLSEKVTLVSQLRKEAEDREIMLEGLRISKEAKSNTNASLDSIHRRPTNQRDISRPPSQKRRRHTIKSGCRSSDDRRKRNTIG